MALVTLRFVPDDPALGEAVLEAPLRLVSGQVEYCLLLPAREGPGGILRACFRVHPATGAREFLSADELRELSDRQTKEAAVDRLPAGPPQEQEIVDRLDHNKPELRTSASGKLHAATRYDLIFRTSMNTILYVDVHDARSGRRLKRHTIHTQSPASSSVDFVGETLYVRDCVAAGPGCAGYLLDARDGRRLATVGGAQTPANVFDAPFVRAGDSVYVFWNSTGAAAWWLNVKTGALEREARFGHAACIERGVRAISGPDNELYVIYGAACEPAEAVPGTLLVLDGRSGTVLREFAP